MSTMIGQPQGAEILIILAIGLGCLAPCVLLVWLIVKLARRP